MIMTYVLSQKYYWYEKALRKAENIPRLTTIL